MIQPTGQTTRIKKATKKLTAIYNRCRPALQKYALPLVKYAPEAMKWMSAIARIHELLS